MGHLTTSKCNPITYSIGHICSVQIQFLRNCLCYCVCGTRTPWHHAMLPKTNYVKVVWRMKLMLLSHLFLFWWVRRGYCMVNLRFTLGWLISQQLNHLSYTINLCVFKLFGHVSTQIIAHMLQYGSTCMVSSLSPAPPRVSSFWKSHSTTDYCSKKCRNTCPLNAKLTLIICKCKYFKCRWRTLTPFTQTISKQGQTGLC